MTNLEMLGSMLKEILRFAFWFGLGWSVSKIIHERVK